MPQIQMQTNRKRRLQLPYALGYNATAGMEIKKEYGSRVKRRRQSMEQIDLLDAIAADLELDALDTAELLRSPSMDDKPVIKTDDEGHEFEGTGKPAIHIATVDPDAVVASYHSSTSPSDEPEFLKSLCESISAEPRGVKSEKTAKTITDNAERCRRHRQKKREAEEKVYTDNEMLKKEREYLANKLSELQLEVQALRGQAVVDLSKENELLKAQIKEHKQYIEKVVQVALTTPLKVDEMEKMRLMRSAIEAGVGQVVGLAYSSLHSESWQQAAPFNFNFSSFDGPEIKPLYQYLPLGSTAETATRVVVRMDVNNIPINWEDAAAVHASNLVLMSNADTMKAYWERIPVLSVFDFIPICPVVPFSETRDMCCVGSQMKIGDKKKQIVVAVGYKDVEMYASAFSPDESIDPFQAQNARVCVSTHVDAVPSVDPSIETEHAISTEAAIIREGENNTTNVTVIQCWPLHSSVSHLMLGGEPLMDEQARIHTKYIQLVKFQIEDLLRQHMEGGNE